MPLRHSLQGFAYKASPPRLRPQGFKASKASPPRLRLQGFASKASPARLRLQGFASKVSPPRLRLQGFVSKALPLRLHLQDYASKASPTRLRLQGFASKATPPRLRLQGYASKATPPRLRLQGYASKVSKRCLSVQEQDTLCKLDIGHVPPATSLLRQGRECCEGRETHPPSFSGNNPRMWLGRIEVKASSCLTTIALSKQGKNLVFSKWSDVLLSSDLLALLAKMSTSPSRINSFELTVTLCPRHLLPSGPWTDGYLTLIFPLSRILRHTFPICPLSVFYGTMFPMFPMVLHVQHHPSA